MKKAELRFTGSGGQGVIMATIILAEAAYADKLQAVQSQSYGPEARGGLCKAECIIDEKPIAYTKVVLPNLLLSLTQASLDKYVGSLQDNSVVVVDSSITVPEEVKAHHQVISLPILSSAVEVIKNPDGSQYHFGWRGQRDHADRVRSLAGRSGSQPHPEGDRREEHQSIASGCTAGKRGPRGAGFLKHGNK